MKSGPRARILVVGGAGYVGGSVAAGLVDRGFETWILDDLSTGHRQAVPGANLTVARAGDRAAVAKLLREGRFDAVFHFAASALVGESMRLKDLYFENNVEQTRLLIDEMLNAGVDTFVFSSTCAVFGDPGDERIHEDLPKNPTNVYGQTKLDAERLIEKAARERGLKATVLRYFNAAGSEPGLRVGEWHDPETHLIPNALEAVLTGGELTVNGADYNTPDGTCVRDYVHVSDLGDAHVAAFERMRAMGKGGSFEAFNLGSESGYSVLEVARACERVVGKPLKLRQGPRRPGDPPFLVADSSIIEGALAWRLKRQERARLVLLDRDGTINIDPGYLSRPEQLELLPGVGEALGRLQAAGFLLAVVSNQSGVGRGLIEEAALPRIHERLNRLLAPHGARIELFQLCIHHPDAGCDCRKPKGKLLVDAAARLGVPIGRSYMVGDKTTDLGAGRAAGCSGVALVRTGDGQTAEIQLKGGEADFVGRDLGAVADWILEKERREGRLPLSAP
jgi:UDP-glucose 4-epimerase